METAGIKTDNVRRDAPHNLFIRKGMMAAVDRKQRAVRIGLTFIACAVAAQAMGYLRGPIAKILSYPEAVSMLIYLETGRVVKPTLPVDTIQPTETEASQPPTQPESAGIFFAEADAELVEVSNFCNYAVNIPALLTTQLQWDLTEDLPKVLILHSHATESYTQTAQFSYQQSSAYRTLDTQYNMVRVGEALKEALEAKGIVAIHDTTLHDHPSYNDSYINSRETAQQWLQKHPSISLVIDLHRDAAGNTSGGQLNTGAVVEGEASAQLMLVVGSNAGGRNHPGWKQNMALAAKLHAQLEKRFPGICRPISFRTERFNQDLSAGALLIEVGAAGDTLEEALVAARALAEGISDLALGTVTADSTS